MNRVICKTGLLVVFAVWSAVLFGQTQRSGYMVSYGCDVPGRGYPDSSKFEEGMYVNDRKEGKWIRYQTDGTTIKLVTFFENGRPNGQFESVYPNGKMKESGRFHKNMYSDTLKRFYENGQLEYIGWYNEAGKEHGTIRYFYPNGQEELVMNTVNGIPTDTAMRYYDNGEIKEIITYDSEGDVTHSKHYEQQYPAPVSGEKAPAPFHGCAIGNGFKPDGYNKIHNDDNDIWQDGTFKEGRLWNGKVYVYSIDGILEQVRIYKNGTFDSFGQL